MSEDPEILLRRERLVSENLAARVGQLMRENIELLIRIHDLEQQHQTEEEGAP